MKLMTVFLICIFNVTFLWASAADIESKILFTQGSVNMQTTSGIKVPILGQTIKGLQSIKIEQGALKIAEVTKEILLFANTEVKFEADSLQLIKGNFRLLSKNAVRLKIQAPVAHVNIDGTDFLLRYETETAQLEVLALDGKAWIKGIYREDEQQLEKGRRGGFKGVLEKDGPAFDQMLQGKKIVRGDLLSVELIKDDELKKINDTFFLENQKIIVKPKPKPKLGQICESPFAKLNECVWRKKSGQCIRERCYANGTWGDSTVMPDKQTKLCDQSDKVGVCDY